jgi:hypothetical protein
MLLEVAFQNLVNMSNEMSKEVDHLMQWKLLSNKITIERHDHDNFLHQQNLDEKIDIIINIKDVVLPVQTVPITRNSTPTIARPE